MKKIIFSLAVVMAAVSANAAYLSWQVNGDGTYNAAGIAVYDSSNDYQTTLDITAVPTGHKSTYIGDYGEGYSYAVEYITYDSSTGTYEQGIEGDKFTYAQLYNLGVLYENDSWATGAQKALMWNGVQAVPEPTSGLMVLLGMALLGLKRKKA